MTNGGDLLWSFQTGDVVQSSPAVVRDTVYIGSHDNNVYAIDARNGTEQWRFKTSGAIRSSPTVVNGTLYVGSIDGNLYAIDARTGTEKWRFHTNGYVRSSPKVADATVYIGSNDKNVYAVDARNGAEQWRFHTDSPIQSSPAVADGTVYITSGAMNSDNGTIHAIDSSDGTENWHYQTDDPIRSSPAVALGLVYIGCDDGHIYALNAKSGAQQWRFQIGGPVRPSPTVAGEVVYVGPSEVFGDRGTLYAVEARKGAELWRFKTGSPLRSSPAVANGTVYVGSNYNTLYAVDTSDGTDQWHFQANNLINSSPKVADGVVYFGSHDNTLYAVDTGTVRLGSSVPDSPSSVESSQTNETPLSSRRVREQQSDNTVSDSERTSTRTQQSLAYDDIEKGDPIGSGGNADVYYATTEVDKSSTALALKEPRMGGTLHTDVVTRILDEAETWQELDNHNHIVSVVDYGSDPLPWIAMEYMDAGDLTEYAGEIAFERALWTALCVTKGVRHAHRHGVAHLDLKPENVLFQSVEDAWNIPKVADWGLSKHLLNHSKSIEGMSPHYAAPEQFDTEFGSTDNITDIYQLGAVFYELFTGRPPFEGRPTEVMRAVMDKQPTPPSEVADIPPEIDEILLTALATNKQDRYEHVLYLRDDLQELWDE